MTDSLSFLDRQRDAALARAHATSDRHRVLRDIVCRGDRTARIGDVITVTDGDGTTGSFAVEYTSRGAGKDVTTWMAVHNGQSGRMHFRTPDFALLHLITMRRGVADPTAVVFAGRVLDITDDAPEG